MSNDDSFCVATFLENYICTVGQIKILLKNLVDIFFEVP